MDDDEYREHLRLAYSGNPARLDTVPGLRGALEDMQDRMPIHICIEALLIAGSKRVRWWMYRLGMWFVRKSGIQVIER